jgi:hypothetical protein
VDRVVEVYLEPGASGYALIRRLTAGDAVLPSALEALGGEPVPAADLLPH